ncbi:MAG: hypothetical protein VW455_07890 [Nitrospinota bacterium]
MKFVILFIFSLFIGTTACSADPEKKQEPPKKESIQKKSVQIESEPVKRPNTKPPSVPVQEHISGGGRARISGAPTTTHISGH